ncbi:methyl-accepting chemotaxis protein [Caulobacter sp. KR2-114]|uniref:methyl-accepting chemotaxis protein n=1 Tax=Caulobacter sp. KR2-114 TaxID=3400912 RepID=UPI003C0A4C9C
MNTIKSRVALACGAVFVICALIAGVGAAAVSQLSGQIGDGQRSAQLVQRHMEADQAHDAINGDVKSALLAADPTVGGDLDKIRADLDDHAAQIQNSVQRSRSMARDPAIVATLAALDAPIQAYVASAKSLVGKVASDRAGAAADLPAFNAKFKFLEKAMDEASQKIEAADDASARRGEALGRIAMLVMFAALAVAVAAAGALVVLSRRVLVRPLEELARSMARLAAGDTAAQIAGAGRPDEIGAMAKATESFRQAALAKAQVEADARAQEQRADADRRAAEAQVLVNERSLVAGSLGKALTALAAGDLTYRMADEIPAEYRQLRDDFNSAIAELENTLTVILGNAGGISAGADEIAQASDDLSRRTEQQAASLEETAAALDQITATVKQTAHNSRQANEAVNAAKADAVRSGEVVSGAVAAMGAIEQSSGKITQIIGVIDEIAFQTNLLALNAGVEAARAGEAGRGFAVVASEVRALAQRSAEAAKEIKALISASSAQVGQGVELVGETGKALQSIVSRVAELDALVTQIASSAAEQATGLSEVNSAVNQMDQVVQQNAAMVEQATAATHSLKGDTGELTQLIARFRVSGGAVKTTTAASPRKVATPAPKMRAAGGGGSVVDGWEEF